MDTTLHGQTDLAGFRAQARQLLAHQVPPEQVHWLLDPQADAGFGDPELPNSSRPRNVARAATAIVPASFTRLCEFVVLHRDPQRFALLYRLLWRLVHEPNLRNDALDPDMQQAQHMAHAVRRDIHKMKANLHLRTVHDVKGQDIQLACYQPAHHIMATAAAWFGRRIEAARWAIFTPERSVRCEQGILLFGPGVPCEQMPAADAPDEAWCDCYRRVYAAHDVATTSH